MRLPAFFHGSFLRPVAAWLLPIAAFLLQWTFWERPTSHTWLLFYPAVLLATLLGGSNAGIGATILSALLVWYFFLPPLYSWELEDFASSISILIFVATGIGFSVLYQRWLRNDARRRRSEERLRYALDAMHEGIWDTNLATGELFVNDQWLALFGYAPGEIKPNHQFWVDSQHPEDAAKTIQAFDDYVYGRSPTYDIENRIVDRYGKTRWHRSVGKIVERNAAGHGVRIVGTNTDITERKLAEQQVRASEERFRLVVENSPDTVTIWDADGAILYVSPAFETLFGTVPDAMLRQSGEYAALAAGLGPDELTPEHLIEPGAAEGFAQNWLCALQAIKHCIEHPGEQAQYEQRVPALSGGFRDLLYMYQGYLRDSSGGEVVCIMHDVTEHRTLERLLQENNEQLEQQVMARTAELNATVTELESTAAKLQDAVAELQRANAGKDAFMAAASHELRTPLMGILSMSEMLESEARGPLNPAQTQYVTAINENGQRLLAAINSILLYANLVAGNTPIQADPCILHGLCATAVHSLEPKAEQKRQQLTYLVEPGDLMINSDPRGIVQILRLLLDNAVKFTPEEGRIAVTVGPWADTGAHTRVDCSEPVAARAICMAVSDTGIGMTEEQIAGLFQPFSQGDKTLARRYEGLGLGLAYVYKMVELLGGTITVESIPEQGSCFTVLLPAQLCSS